MAVLGLSARCMIIFILVFCLFSPASTWRRRRRRTCSIYSLCLVSHNRGSNDHQQHHMNKRDHPKPPGKETDNLHLPHNDHEHQLHSEDGPEWIYLYMMPLCLLGSLAALLPCLLLCRVWRSKITMKPDKEAPRLEQLKCKKAQELSANRARRGKHVVRTGKKCRGSKKQGVRKNTGCSSQPSCGGHLLVRSLALQLISGTKEQSDVNLKVPHSGTVRIDSQIDPSFDAGPDIGAAVNQVVREMEAKMLAFISSSNAPLKTRKYDCFIIYSRDDEGFVYEKLIPFFKRNKIKYCEHQEHFELGKDIFANANSCIVCSRRVVAVLSKSFFESGFCMADLNAARGYAAENNVQDFVISVKITNCDIPSDYANIKRSTYADLSEDVNDKKTWLQIKKAFTDVRLASVRIEMSFECHTPELNEPDVYDVVPGEEA
ncbi:uncharacterized protein LOC144922637 [Branchiostoma floridae x Branchiostoma belcheri]